MEQVQPEVADASHRSKKRVPPRKDSAAHRPSGGVLSAALQGTQEHLLEKRTHQAMPRTLVG